MAETQENHRLLKMREHDMFPEALALEPGGGEECRQASRQITNGLVGAVLGALLILWSWPGWFGILVGALVVIWCARRILAAQKVRSSILQDSLEKRPAMVTDRRSETAFNGWSGRVTYFFQLEFEDGSKGEFRFPGRGWSYDPLQRGATGVAYTRGKNLLEFRHIKV